MTKPRYIRHFPKPHISAHGHRASKYFTRVSFMFDVTIQNMGESTKKSRVCCYKP